MSEYKQANSLITQVRVRELGFAQQERKGREGKGREGVRILVGCSSPAKGPSKEQANAWVPGVGRRRSPSRRRERESARAHGVNGRR